MHDPVADVGQRCYAPGLAGRLRGSVEGAHGQQHQHDSGVERGFHGEVPKEPRGEYQDATDEGAKYAGAGDGQRVDRVCIYQGLARHRVGNQHLLHRLGDRQAGTGNQHVGVGVPGSHQVGGNEKCKAQRQRGAEGLQYDNQLAPVEAIAQDARHGIYDQAGHGIDRADRYHQQPADARPFGQPIDQPSDAQQLEPLGREPAEIGEPEQAEIAVFQPCIQRMEARQSQGTKNGLTPEIRRLPE